MGNSLPTSSEKIIDVIIPAYNEEKSIPLVIREIPNFVRNVVVANNNSTDQTKEEAEKETPQKTM